MIPPNFVTLRELKERRDREQMIKLQQSIQVEKEDESEAKKPWIAPILRKEEKKEEGSFHKFSPKPLIRTIERSLGRGPSRQSSIIDAQEVAEGSSSQSKKKTKKKHLTKYKKESSAEDAGVSTEMPLVGLSHAFKVAMEEKRTKATTALLDGGKTGGHVTLDIERRISCFQINGGNSNPSGRGKGIAGGRDYVNHCQKSSSSEDMMWAAKKSLKQKFAGPSYASEVAMEEKQKKATIALANGGKTGGHVALDIERRSSGLQIKRRNSNPSGRGKVDGNYLPLSSSSKGMVWVAKESLNQKNGVAGNK